MDLFHYWLICTFPSFLLSTINYSPPAAFRLCRSSRAHATAVAKLFENGARPDPADLQKLADKYDIVFRFDKLAEVIKKYGVSL